MKFIEQLKVHAKKLKKEISVIYYAYKNPQTKLLPKLMILFTLGYALSPIDLIPDFVPVLGYLDDLVILPLLIALAIKLIPAEVMDAAREQAAKEPIRLRKHWPFAILFIGIWCVVISVMVMAVVRMIH